MTAKIPLESVKRQIWRLRQDQIAALIRRGDTTMPYPFAKFRQDMASTDLIVDIRTLRTKWLGLVGDRTVGMDDGNPETAYLVFRAFRAYMDSETLGILEGRHTQAHTSAGVRA